jgi:hypothetical protein
MGRLRIFYCQVDLTERRRRCGACPWSISGKPPLRRQACRRRATEAESRQTLVYTCQFLACFPGKTPQQGCETVRQAGIGIVARSRRWNCREDVEVNIVEYVDDKKGRGENPAPFLISNDWCYTVSGL